MSGMPLHVRWLGRVPYREALAVQQALPDTPHLLYRHNALRPPRHPIDRWRYRARYERLDGLVFVSVAERDAFVRIHREWKRLGYPFETLAPSLATAIGSSGDRPSALAELMGIIQNGGIRAPTLRIEPDAAVISTLRCGKSAERSIDSQCHRCTDQLLEFSRFD